MRARIKTHPELVQKDLVRAPPCVDGSVGVTVRVPPSVPVFTAVSAGWLEVP
jgi:hypothetical protein